MTVKLVATDMDGTWLTDEKTYDHDLFMKSFKLMQEQDVKFVVASGNQFENLQTRFPEMHKDIYYVAENGGLVAEGTNVLKTNVLSKEDLTKILDQLDKYEYPVVAAGLNYGYVTTDEMYVSMQRFYHKLKKVSSLRDVEDKIFKLSVLVDSDKRLALYDDLCKNLPTIGIVSAGPETIDLATAGLSKADGLKFLSKKLGISPKEMIAFGDSGNDVEMLRYVGRAYVTAQALPEAKRVANKIIGSNNDSAVQKELYEILKNNK
ncbi:MAG: HAD family hydrolase [Lactobacillus sp.]|nr:HAD family hydrolase [Lactobacillus sp.]